MSLIMLLLRHGGDFLDVGANIGSYALIASESETARVFAVEPDPETYRELEGNIRLNRRRNIMAFNFALGAQCGVICLSQGSTSATHRVERQWRPGVIQVPIRTAAELILEIRSCPGIVKIDTEGHEREILEGFGPELRSVDYVFIEISRENQAVEALLSSAGLDGPYYVDYEARKITTLPVPPGWEDPLFVSRRAQFALSSLGFRFNAGSRVGTQSHPECDDSDHTQNATIAANATAERKFMASLS